MKTRKPRATISSLRREIADRDTLLLRTGQALSMLAFGYQPARFRRALSVRPGCLECELHVSYVRSPRCATDGMVIYGVGPRESRPTIVETAEAFIAFCKSVAPGDPDRGAMLEAIDWLNTEIALADSH